MFSCSIYTFLYTHTKGSIAFLPVRVSFAEHTILNKLDFLLFLSQTVNRMIFECETCVLLSSTIQLDLIQ